MKTKACVAIHHSKALVLTKCRIQKNQNYIEGTASSERLKIAAPNGLFDLKSHVYSKIVLHVDAPLFENRFCPAVYSYIPGQTWRCMHMQDYLE
jgi:hypothetical protein